MTLHAAKYDRIPGLPGALLRRFGAHTLIVRHGDRAAGWTDDRTFAVDDGTITHHTAIATTFERFPAMTRLGDAAMVIAGTGDRFAEVGFDGHVRSWAALPYVFDAVAELAGDRIAALSRRRGEIVVFERANGELRPHAAFLAPNGNALRAVADGRLLLVGYDTIGAAEGWWFDDDDTVRVVARFEGLGEPVDFDVATDETAKHWERPTWTCLWDIDAIYEVLGVDALASVDRTRFVAPPSAAVPDQAPRAESLGAPPG